VCLIVKHWCSGLCRRCCTQGPTGQGKLETVREFEWSGKARGNIFFGKVRENEKFVPSGVRFSG